MNATDLLQSRITFLEQENSRLVARLAQMQTELSSALATEEKSLEFCIGLTGTSPDKIRSAFSERDELREELAAERAIAAEKEKVKALEAELDRLAAGNSSMEKEIPQLRKALENSESGAAAFREVISDCVGIFRGSCPYCCEASERLERAESSTAGASLLARIAELEALVAGLEQDRERMRSALDTIATKFPKPTVDGRPWPWDTTIYLTPADREAINQARTTEIERRKA